TRIRLLAAGDALRSCDHDRAARSTGQLQRRDAPGRKRRRHDHEAHGRWRQDADGHRRPEGCRLGDPLRDKFTGEETPEERQRLIDRIMASPSYRIAFEDSAFLHEDSVRPARLQLELMKPERTLLGHHIKSTIVVFGSARVQSPTITKKEVAELEARAKKGPESEGLSKRSTRRRSAPTTHATTTRRASSRAWARNASSQ